MSASPIIMNTLLEKFHTISFRAVKRPLDVGCFAIDLIRNTRWMTGGYHVLVVAAMKSSIANAIRMCLSAEREQPRSPSVSVEHSP